MLMYPPMLPAGIYQHYKGGYYQALGYGHDSNNGNRIVVVYVGLTLAGAKAGPRLACRTAVSAEPDEEAWWDYVHGDGSKCLHGSKDGQECEAGEPVAMRFRYTGIYKTAGME